MPAFGWLRLLVTAGLFVAMTMPLLPAERAVAGTDTRTVGGQVIGDPNFGNLAVFIGGGSLVEHFYSVATNRWTTTKLPGAVGQWNPVAIGNPNGGNIAVFYAGSDQKLYYDYFFGATGTWAPTPFQLSDDILGSPAVLGDPSSGNIAVFWGDSHKHLDEKFYFGASNTWSGLFLIATAIDSSPAALGSPDGGNIALFYTSNGLLVESYYFSSTNSWNAPFVLATDAWGGPTALGDPDTGNIAVFYTTHTNSNGLRSLEEKYYFVATNSWGGPYKLPGSTGTGPFAAIGSPNHGKIAVYYENNSDTLQDIYDPATNTWAATNPPGFTNIISQPVAVGDPNGGNLAVFYFIGLIDGSAALELSYQFGSTGPWTNYLI